MDIATASFADIAARGRRLAEQDPKPLTAPGMFQLAAKWANQYDDNAFEQRIALMLIDAVTPHLNTGETADWWHALRSSLIKRQQTADMGPNWDEVGIDWDARATEAANVLAGAR